MLWQVTNIDRTTLVAALLPTVKDHCRVTFADDDNIIKTYTSVAVGQLEQVWGFQIFGLDGTWKPELPSLAPLDRLVTPVSPAASFTSVDADGADNTAAFELLNKGMVNATNWLATTDGSDFPAGVVVSLKAGFVAPDEMPPEALGAILQVTSRLYEYRENIQSFSVNLIPMWMNELLVGLWQPRA